MPRRDLVLVYGTKIQLSDIDVNLFHIYIYIVYMIIYFGLIQRRI